MNNLQFSASIPATYQQLNYQNALISPSTVHVSGSGLSLFFQRCLFQRAMSVFKWEGIPEHWAKNYFETVLWMWGWIAVIKTDKFGVIPQGCGLSGYDVFYQPTHAVISNPLLQGLLEPRIGRECEIIHLSPDYRGIYDLISYYGDQLALAAQAVGMNLVNSKLAYLFAVKDKASAESMKKAYDQMIQGNPAVVVDKNLLTTDGRPTWMMFNQDLRSNYITTQLLNDMRAVQNMFDAEVGIPNANTTKRERLISDEVNANNVETAAKSALWLETLRECCDKVNAMFGLTLQVDWRFPHTAEGGDDSDSMDQRAGVVDDTPGPVRPDGAPCWD